MSTGLTHAVNLIRKSKRIAISGHINPDGDSIGSLLALGLGLKRLGKKVYMISQDGVPHRYRRLPGAGKIVRRLERDVDLAIAVDCSNKEILGNTYLSFGIAPELLEIDHHAFRRSFGTAAYIDRHAAAVGEMIYLILTHLGVKFTKDIAQNLMTSIIVETNSFGLPNVTPFTFRVCNELIRRGIDFYKLVDTVFWSKRKEATVLTGICLARCKFIHNDMIAWSIIREKDFRAARGKDEDVDAVPDEMRAIKSVRIAVLFREKDRRTLRVSLRSKGTINVAGIAERHGGGGHFDIAGCSIVNSAISVKNFLRQLEELLS